MTNGVQEVTKTSVLTGLLLNFPNKGHLFTIPRHLTVALLGLPAHGGWCSPLFYAMPRSSCSTLSGGLGCDLALLFWEPTFRLGQKTSDTEKKTRIALFGAD